MLNLLRSNGLMMINICVQSGALRCKTNTSKVHKNYKYWQILMWWWQISSSSVGQWKVGYQLNDSPACCLVGLCGSRVLFQAPWVTGEWLVTQMSGLHSFKWVNSHLSKQCLLFVMFLMFAISYQDRSTHIAYIYRPLTTMFLLGFQ